MHETFNYNVYLSSVVRYLYVHVRKRDKKALTGCSSKDHDIYIFIGPEKKLERSNEGNRKLMYVLSMIKLRLIFSPPKCII